MRVILASASPRRRELLQKIYKDFEVITSNADEDLEIENPEELVKALSEKKAKAVFGKVMLIGAVEGGNVAVSSENSMEGKDVMSTKALANEAETATNGADTLVIGADTIVFYEGDVLGKPEDSDEAKSMLSMLADRTHQVFTGVTIIACTGGEEKTISFCDRTDVTFYDIDKYDIADYVATGSPLDKAGAYGIQDDFAKHVKKIDGDYNNVVGLPVSKLYQTLKENKLI